MNAKQTVVSASLLAWIGGSVVPAHAEPPDEPTGDAASAVTIATSPPDEPCTDAPGCVPESTGEPAPATGEPAPPPRRPGGRFEIGVGYLPDDGFLATATVAQDNLFGTGTQLAMSARMSQRRQLVLMRFTDPALLGSRLGLSVDVYHQRQVFTGFTRQATGGAVTLVHPIGEHVRVFAGYRLEHVDVQTDRAGLARTIEAPDRPWAGDGVISAVRAGVSYSSLDSPVLPTRGTGAGVIVEVADHRLGSEVDLTRVNAWINHHRPLGPFILHVGGTVASVTSRDPLGVPLSERLQLDGSSEVRGYAPGGIGPTDPVSGIPIGGNVKAVGTAELELPLGIAGLSLAGFADAGLVRDLDGRGGLGYSVGAGVIWRSPIGPLRFDWAIPLAEGDHTPRFLFSLGGTF